MKKILLASLVFTAFFIACKSDKPEGQEQTTSETTAALDPATIQLICKPSEEPNTDADAPRHEVFLQLGNSQVKVADILNCETLGKDAYEQYQMPANALSAVGGWWAGAGDYLYVVLEGENYVVKQGSADEARAANDFGYKTVMTFAKDGREVF
ncbi:MAG: hypothetical protein HY842_14165 [Bacteroidetes bacterium]|nr:hypothetical protein [Bacteroidota bacterium]